MPFRYFVRAVRHALLGWAAPEGLGHPPARTRSHRSRACVVAVLTGLAGLPGSVVAEEAVTTTAPSETAPLALLVFERPPYYVLDGNGAFAGLVAGPTAEAMTRAGIPFVWERMQPNGHLRAVEADRAPICAVGWFRTAEREAYARFTDPVYRDAPIAVLTRADNGAVTAHDSLRSLLGAPGLRLGTKLGYAFGAEVDAMIHDLAPPLITASQDDAGLARMLLGQRFDYMLLGFEEADTLIEAFGAAGQDLLAMTMPDAPKGNTRHLLCSQSVDPAVIERFNAALAEPSDELGPQ